MAERQIHCSKPEFLSLSLSPSMSFCRNLKRCRFGDSGGEAGGGGEGDVA